MAKILFVDDDRYFAHQYLEALKAYYDVVTCYEAEAAVEAFRSHPDIVAAVVDVMLPPPRGFEHETHDGFTSGIWILEQCQDIIKSQRTAVLLFTNRALSYVRDEVKFLNFDARLCEVTAKDSIDADDLPHVIGKLIARR